MPINLHLSPAHARASRRDGGLALQRERGARQSRRESRRRAATSHARRHPSRRGDCKYREMPPAFTHHHAHHLGIRKSTDDSELVQRKSTLSVHCRKAPKQIVHAPQIPSRPEGAGSCGRSGVTPPRVRSLPYPPAHSTIDDAASAGRPGVQTPGKPRTIAPYICRRHNARPKPGLAAWGAR